MIMIPAAERIGILPRQFSVNVLNPCLSWVASGIKPFAAIGRQHRSA
ncbi:hypothetical protein [Sphingobium xenophagum]|nr:hypothetical protein [Sphingobium xenophagum]